MHKAKFLAATAAALLTATGAHAQSQISINVTPWVAPNVFGSPNFDGAADNQFTALRNGLPAFGVPGTPTYYQAITGPVPYGANIVTNFNSWMGVANPGAPYQNEYGNGVHYGLFINGNGAQFSISQLSLVFDGDGASNYFDADFGTGYQYGPYDYVGGSYGGYVGIRVGQDGILGTPDDEFVTSGLDTQLVDALIGRGSRISDAVYCDTAPPGDPVAGPCGAGNQGYIDDEIALLKADGFTQLTGTYTLVGTTASGSATVNFVDGAVPEPATWAMMIMGFGLVGASMRRRRTSVSFA